MEWFRVDCGVRNDPKVKALKRRLGLTGVARFLILMDYIASEGDEPGVGVKRGAPLPMLEAAEELDSDEDEARAFVDHCAAVGIVDPVRWRDEGIIMLPAMVERARRYREAKGWDQLNEKRKAERAAAGARRDAAGARRDMAGPSERSRSEIEDQDQEHPPTPQGGGLPLEGPDQCEALVRLYNETVRAPVPKVQQLTDKRRRVYRQALAVIPDLNRWAAVFRFMLGQRWAMGLTPDRQFVWDLDYITRNKGEKALAAEERIRAGQAQAPNGGRDAARGRTGVEPGTYSGLEKDDE